MTNEGWFYGVSICLYSTGHWIGASIALILGFLSGYISD